jgi:hypothetical protein
VVMTDNAMHNVIEPVPIDDVFCTELVKVAARWSLSEADLGLR